MFWALADSPLCMFSDFVDFLLMAVQDDRQWYRGVVDQYNPDNLGSEPQHEYHVTYLDGTHEYIGLPSAEVFFI